MPRILLHNAEIPHFYKTFGHNYESGFLFSETALEWLRARDCLDDQSKLLTQDDPRMLECWDALGMSMFRLTETDKPFMCDWLFRAGVVDVPLGVDWEIVWDSKTHQQVVVEKHETWRLPVV